MTVAMISTSFCTGAGLKKCRPTTRLGARVADYGDWRYRTFSGDGAAASPGGIRAKPLNGGQPMNLEPVTKTIAPRSR